MCTSILDQVSADAAVELTADDQAGMIFVGLARANAFIQSAGPGWYRYHTLFAEVLRLKLRCDSAGKPSGRLMIMNDSDRLPGRGANAGRAVNDPERLAEYEARTREPLDLLALATLWLVVVPWWDYGHVARYIVLAFRVALSVVYGIDIAIRSALAPRHLRYALTHPIALASVLYPPVRVFFSIRLVRSMFRRGHLPRFLAAAVVLVLNGAVIVYLLERHAPGSNIHTLRDALWWAFVTVTTVGYGEFYPVTAGGRVTACFIMGTGLLTLAVVTAQVASSFVAQGPSRANPAPHDEGTRREVTLAELDQRLARIERLLTAPGNSPGATNGD